MSSVDRQPYLTATVLDQAKLDECQDSLVNQLEAVVDILAPDGSYIRASDRNKYVDGVFYEALLNFPTITRTLGDWLTTGIEFSELRLEISNADGRFSKYAPGGTSHASWIGGSVEVRIGLRDVGSTYFTVFKGAISQVNGFGRTTGSIQLSARDTFNKLSKPFPNVIFGKTYWPKIDDSISGEFIPLVWGDWTTQVNPLVGASVPGAVVNGTDPLVEPEKSKDVTITIASPAVLTQYRHGYDNNDKVELETDGTLPSGFSTGVEYYIVGAGTSSFGLATSLGGSAISTSGTQSGTHRIKPSTLSTAVYRNIKCVVSENANTFFDSGNVYVKRGELSYRIDTQDVANVNSDKNFFEVLQNTGRTFIGADRYKYASGDLFFCRVKGKALSGYNDNIVWMARDVLTTYGGLITGDFDSNWNTYRDKATPAQSAIANIKARIWIKEPQTAIEYALSLLQQVRLETFVTKQFTFKLNALHFEDFNAAPGFTIRNWDIERNSLKIAIDDRNNFNRVKGAFSFLPDKGEEAFFTSIYRNNAAIADTGVAVSKQVSFPNLYIQTDVENQIQEVLRLSTSYFEIIDANFTWRSLLKEPGDFVLLTVTIGRATFDNVPCMIRSVTYEPKGLRVTLKLWSLQMTPFPGYTPGYAGTTGGYNASLTVE